MRIHRSSAIGTALLTALALTACGSSSTGSSDSSTASASASATSRAVQTAFGEVTIPTAPAKAIALEGGIGPLLGADITPVATADGDLPDSLLPEEYTKVKDLPVILGPDGYDLEKIAALQPDVLIGFVRADKEGKVSAESKAEWEKLNAIAPTVLILSDGSAGTKDATLKMSEALGDGADAEAAKKAYDTKAEQIKTSYADILAKNVFAPMDYYEEVYVYSPISWPGDTISDVGGKLTKVSSGVSGENAAFLSAEQIGKVDDATVVLFDQGVDGKPTEGATGLSGLPTFKTLPAVKAGHSYGLSYFFADRYETGLKSLESLETTLKKLQ